MSKPDLEYLVRLARRDRPSSTALEAIARRLRVPFVVAPVTAAVLPSSAFAAAAAEVGLSRPWLLGWSAGGALAVTGAVAAVTLGSSPTAPVDAPVAPLRAVPIASATARPAPVELPAPAPEARAPSRSAERQKLRDTPTTWDEPQLIERARQALGTDPKRALALTQEYQRRFPGGALSVEREVIALEALARSGQVAEARKRALAFEARHPSSIHLPRVRALLARLGAP